MKPQSFAIVKLAQTEIQPSKRAFLKKWARLLKVSEDELLRRILIAGVLGQLYAEKIPETR
jgi:hypothetical protein